MKPWEAPLDAPVDSEQLKFSWFIPIDGDGSRAGTLRAERPPDFDYLRKVVETAEDCGFYSLLIPTRFANGLFAEDAPLAETWTTATALAAVTKRIRFLIAVRPGFISLGLFAQMAAAPPPYFRRPHRHQRRAGRHPERFRTGGRDQRPCHPVRKGGGVHRRLPALVDSARSGGVLRGALQAPRRLLHAAARRKLASLLPGRSIPQGHGPVRAPRPTST